MYKIVPPYTELDIGNQSSCVILDHMGGFDPFLKCELLDRINSMTDSSLTVYTEYILDDTIKPQYPALDIRLDIDTWKNQNYTESFIEYKIHPELTFQNFLCSFNGTAHVGRKLLTSILHRFGWFDLDYCSKNFSCSTDMISGHLDDYVDSRFYGKFFISKSSEDFFRSTNSFGHIRCEHDRNIYNLENKLTSSFLHIVSETMATSYYPFVTEKFLYSVVTRGLFLAYAQPGWHDHLERYYGFRKYNKLFDYRFDLIPNPVERLVELMSMIAKFSVLSSDDWRDLYDMEMDTIEFNYDHYFSQNYLKKLAESS